MNARRRSGMKESIGYKNATEGWKVDPSHSCADARHKLIKPESRALCNGKTLAFQAKDAGSIPAARSKITPHPQGLNTSR
jgi:hypothetical protein